VNQQRIQKIKARQEQLEKIKAMGRATREEDRQRREREEAREREQERHRSLEAAEAARQAEEQRIREQVRLSQEARKEEARKQRQDAAACHRASMDAAAQAQAASSGEPSAFLTMLRQGQGLLQRLHDQSGALLEFVRGDDSEGRVAPANGAPVDVSVRRTLWHDYGLYAWVVRKSTAKLLLRQAFPVGGQVDKAVTGWLARERGCTFKVDPHNMLLHSPKSEESQDSDVQTLGSIHKLVQEHGDVETYNERIASERNLFQDYY